jgi:hypothetical protein
MAVACNLFILFDARYDNRSAGPWPKHMHICLGMEPNRVHTNFTMDDRAEPKHVRSQISTLGWSQHASLDFSETHFLTSYIFSGARDPRASCDHGAAGRFFTRARDPYAQCIHLLTGACSLCPQRSRPSPAPLPFTRT